MASDSDIMVGTIIHINDLPNELLNDILSFLSDEQLFVIESVCKRWKNLANKAMERITELNPNNFRSTFDKSHLSYIIDDSNIDTFKVILTKCPNIKYFDLHNTLIKGNNLV